jgi:hypothetical protein
LSVCGFVLTGEAEGIYSVRAAGTGLFGLFRVYVGDLVGTDVFRVDQGVWLTCMRDCAPSYELSAAITFE